MKTAISGTIAALGLVLFMFSSAGSAIAQDADNQADVAEGRVIYEASCAGCHGEDGTGVAGRGRPLIGIASQGDRATHVESVTNGKGGMPAFGERLSGEEVDQSISYVRLTFVEPAAAQPTELAITGATTTGLAIVGLVMLVAGAQLVVWSRRYA